MSRADRIETLWVGFAALAVVALGGFIGTILDRRRIREYFDIRGLKVRDITHNPFRRRWPDGNRNRTYQVIVEATDGTTQRLFCVTSLFEQVFVLDESENPLAMDLQAAGRALANKRRSGGPPKQQ